MAKSQITHAYPHCWRLPSAGDLSGDEAVVHDHRSRSAPRPCRGGDRIRVRWQPESSQNRIRDAVRLRPDWCLSPPASVGRRHPRRSTVESGDHAVLDPGVMRHAASLARAHAPMPGTRSRSPTYFRPTSRVPSAGCRGRSAKRPTSSTCVRLRRDASRVRVTTRAERMLAAGARERSARRSAASTAQRDGPGRVLRRSGPASRLFQLLLMVGVGIDASALQPTCSRTLGAGTPMAAPCTSRSVT